MMPIKWKMSVEDYCSTSVNPKEVRQDSKLYHTTTSDLMRFYTNQIQGAQGRERCIVVRKCVRRLLHKEVRAERVEHLEDLLRRVGITQGEIEQYREKANGFNRIT